VEMEERIKGEIEKVSAPRRADRREIWRWWRSLAVRKLDSMMPERRRRLSLRR